MVFLNARMESDPVTLVIIMLMFCAAIWGALRAAAMLGLTRHAARVYVIAAFLLVSVTTVQNTVLPLMVFVTHALSCRRRPCKAVYPELDCVAALALVSFWWLAVEKIIGNDDLPYYGLTTMGMSIGFVALIVAMLPPAYRWGSLIGFGAGMVWLFHALMDGHGAGALWLSVAVAVCAALPPLLRPDWFHAARAGKGAVLASAMPMLACLWDVGVTRGAL